MQGVISLHQILYSSLQTCDPKDLLQAFLFPLSTVKYFQLLAGSLTSAYIGKEKKLQFNTLKYERKR